VSQRLVKPLISGATYRCGVHLLLGAVIALPYVLLTASFALVLASEPQELPWVAVLLLVTLLIALTPAFLAGVRSLEISAAREVLGADVPLPTGAVSSATRLRSALWFVVHLLSGGVLAVVLLIAVPTALVFILQRFGSDTQIVDTSGLGFLDGVDRWWLLGLGIGLLLAIPYGTAAAGVGLRRLAPILLGPSPEERIAALEAHARSLAERNRLARDLHDSVGHALTITTVQAAAAQQVGDTPIPLSSPGRWPRSRRPVVRRWPIWTTSWACCAPEKRIPLQRQVTWRRSAAWPICPGWSRRPEPPARRSAATLRPTWTRFRQPSHERDTA